MPGIFRLAYLASLGGEDAHYQSRDAAEVGFILGAGEHAAPQAARGGGDGDIVLGNHRAALGQLGEDIGMMFCRFGGERLDAGESAQSFKPGKTPRRTDGGIRQPNPGQGFSPDHSGQHQFLVVTQGNIAFGMDRPLPGDQSRGVEDQAHGLAAG
jgi:hypothetical protein